MPFTPRNGQAVGVPNTNISQIRMASYKEPPIEYLQNNLQTLALTRSNPIASLQLRLTGNTVIGTAASDYKNDPFGMWSLIRLIEVKIDGEETVLSLPGYALPLLSQTYNEGAPDYKSGTPEAVGTNAFVTNVNIPFDVGSYFSLLDASQNKNLSLHVHWGHVDDVMDIGASGTQSVNSVQLHTTVFATAGFANGVRGGTRYPYFRHILNHEIFPVTAETAEKVEPMLHKRLWNNMQFYCMEDGVLSDGVLDNVMLRVQNNTIVDRSQALLRAQNFQRYKLDTAWTGQYILDFAEPAHAEQMISLADDSQKFHLGMEVKHPGSDDKIIVVRDHFIAPQAA